MINGTQQSFMNVRITPSSNFRGQQATVLLRVAALFLQSIAKDLVMEGYKDEKGDETSGWQYFLWVIQLSISK